MNIVLVYFHLCISTCARMFLQQFFSLPFNLFFFFKKTNQTTFNSIISVLSSNNTWWHSYSSAFFSPTPYSLLLFFVKGDTFSCLGEDNYGRQGTDHSFWTAIISTGAEQLWRAISALLWSRGKPCGIKRRFPPSRPSLQHSLTHAWFNKYCRPNPPWQSLCWWARASSFTVSCKITAQAPIVRRRLIGWESDGKGIKYLNWVKSNRTVLSY